MEKSACGKAHFDEAFITGESKPVEKTVGDKVIAGSINFDGYLEYKAERIGKESTISEIVRLVVEASNCKAPISKMADRMSGYFVPSVLLISILTFIVYLLLGYDFATSILTFVTILVVACPCSLGLATPLAIVVAEGLCASKGILIKKGEILENAQKVDTMVFDKTGTLTYGTLRVAEIKNESDLEDAKLMQIVGSLESQSTHPIAKAFSDYLQENQLEKWKVNDFQNEAGYGICGKIENQTFRIGNAKMLEKYNIENKFAELEKELSLKRNSIVYVVRNEELLAIIGVNDIVRENVGEVIQKLKENKIETIMLTGDNQDTAKKIADEIGMEKVIANVLPAEKTQVVKDLKQEKKYVMMCGDGINDSPALVSADIGVSIHSGTDIAMDSADVILTSNRLESILDLMVISKKTMKVIKQNLFWAFFYNVLMIPVAMGLFQSFGIHINPMIGSFAMVVSSLTVIMNTLRLRNL